MTTHNQYQQCTESIQLTSRTLAGRIEGIKQEEEMKARSPPQDFKQKLRFIEEHLDELEVKTEKLQHSFSKLSQAVECDLRPQNEEFER